MMPESCLHRYERSTDRAQRGSSVVQRHVAMQEEVDIAEGKGRLVGTIHLVMNQFTICTPPHCHKHLSLT